MKIIRGFQKFPLLASPTVVAIGNFDGLHLGHQKILRFLVERSQKKRLSSLVLTFYPHPETTLGKSKIDIIQTLSQRLKVIKKFGVQAVLVTPFNKTFSNLSSEAFIQKILVNTLKAKEVIVGENFLFGKNREGGVARLKQLGSQYGFTVHSLPPQKKKGRIVSSSLIRELLLEGKVEEANVFLGRFYQIEGKVIKGEERGIILGFPTANIQTANEILPQGVFISLAEINSQIYPSLTNVGKRPTFEDKGLVIESHLMDFSQKVYGRKIKLSFLKKIREEKSFPTPHALFFQIKKDLKAARAFFYSKPKLIDSAIK
jgi:riboflavin kinase/FMN adenylyltransferase